MKKPSTYHFSIHQRFFSNTAKYKEIDTISQSLINKTKVKAWMTWKQKNHQNPYLCNSFGTSVLHHARPSSHQCDAEQHPHKNPRKQTHFPRFQTPPSPFQHKNTNPKVKPKTNTPTWEKSTNSSKKKTKLSVKFEKNSSKGLTLEDELQLERDSAERPKVAAKRKTQSVDFFFFFLLMLGCVGLPSPLWVSFRNCE